jgi:ornithine cyclodeaminase/alanine dehydrogenase-like protein (mu-crystallin family)
MRLLTAADVNRALSMSEAIDAIKTGFIALSAGQAQMPVRASLPVPGGLTLTMPAYISGEPISTVKVVSVCAGNTAAGLPVVMGSVLVIDAKTGQIRALIEGSSLTALRTGAASGLATDLLARPEASILAVIGAGVQARTQIAAVCAVRPIKTIRIYSPNNAAKLAEELHALYRLKTTAMPDAHSALIGADVVVAATNSSTPVVRLQDVAPGVHINGVGSYRHDMQEIAAEIVSRAKVVIDHRASAWQEAGDLIIARDRGMLRESDVVEIGEVAAGLQLGRTSPEQITFFKSVGSAVQDAAVAARILAVAEAQNLGTVVNF